MYRDEKLSILELIDLLVIGLNPNEKLGVYVMSGVREISPKLIPKDLMMLQALEKEDRFIVQGGNINVHQIVDVDADKGQICCYDNLKKRLIGKFIIGKQYDPNNNQSEQEINLSD